MDISHLSGKEWKKQKIEHGSQMQQSDYPMDLGLRDKTAHQERLHFKDYTLYRIISGTLSGDELVEFSVPVHRKAWDST